MQNKNEVLENLKKLEIFIHWPEFGTTKDQIENLLDYSFCEVGASGKRYGREIILKVLIERAQIENREVWKSENFDCVELATDVFLLTYTIYQGERKTERSSIWKKFNSGFKLIYHQGTVAD